MAVIDFKKVFDVFNREKLWEKIHRSGLDGKLLQAVISLYRDERCYVRIDGTDTLWFDVICGLKEGCPLSDILFNLYINDLVRYQQELNVGIKTDDELCVYNSMLMM